jgi:hypothetical protein
MWDEWRPWLCFTYRSHPYFVLVIVFNCSFILTIVSLAVLLRSSEVGTVQVLHSWLSETVLKGLWLIKVWNQDWYVSGALLPALDLAEDMQGSWNYAVPPLESRELSYDRQVVDISFRQPIGFLAETIFPGNLERKEKIEHSKCAV